MGKFLKIVGLVLGGIIAVVVIVLVAGTLLGYVYAGFKQPAQVVTLRTVACTDTDIKTYNAFVTSFPTNDAEQKDKAAKMQAQVDSLKKKAGFDQDPTCQFIGYSAAIAASNGQLAQQYYAAIVVLSGKNIFPSNQLLDVGSLDSMKSRIDALVNTNQTTSNPMGSG